MQSMDFGSPSRYGNAGGFHQSGQLSHDSPSTSSSSSGGMERKKRDLQSLTPVTVRQMLNHEMGEKLVIDGKEMGQLELVGHLSKIEFTHNVAAGIFHDLTGVVPLNMYLPADTGDELNVLKRKEMEELTQSKYVKVYGMLKIIKDEKVLSATAIRPVTDMNALTYHALNVLHTHLRNTKGPLSSSSGNSAQRQPNNAQLGGNNFANSMPNIHSSSSSMDSYHNGGMSTSNSISNETFTPLQLDILNTVQAGTHDDTGCHIMDVVNRLKHKYPMAEIQIQTTFLTDEGHFFTTIDEQHIKRTNA